MATAFQEREHNGQALAQAMQYRTGCACNIQSAPPFQGPPRHDPSTSPAEVARPRFPNCSKPAAQYRKTVPVSSNSAGGILAPMAKNRLLQHGQSRPRGRLWHSISNTSANQAFVKLPMIPPPRHHPGGAGHPPCPGPYTLSPPSGPSPPQVWPPIHHMAPARHRAPERSPPQHRSRSILTAPRAGSLPRTLGQNAASGCPLDPSSRTSNPAQKENRA